MFCKRSLKRSSYLVQSKVVHCVQFCLGESSECYFMVCVDLDFLTNFEVSYRMPLPEHQSLLLCCVLMAVSLTVACIFDFRYQEQNLIYRVSSTDPSKLALSVHFETNLLCGCFSTNQFAVQGRIFAFL